MKLFRFKKKRTEEGRYMIIGDKVVSVKHNY